MGEAYSSVPNIRQEGEAIFYLTQEGRGCISLDGGKAPNIRAFLAARQRKSGGLALLLELQQLSYIS